MEKMLSDKKGEMVVLAGDNQKKTKYILESVKTGYHVLSDKPMAICEEDFELLRQAYEIAGSKGLVIYELMTERYDILNMSPISHFDHRRHQSVGAGDVI